MSRNDGSITIDRNGFLVNFVLANKAPCRVATTGSITLSGIQVIDGVTVEQDNRVLVKDQSDNLNGIYLAKSGDWELADDFDQRGHCVKGTTVLVNEGTVGALTQWYVTTEGRPFPGRQTINFAQLTVSATTFLQAGTGAVARTYLDKDRQRVDVEDFGAVGDGATDDLAAIQKAIDHVVNEFGGGDVCFDALEYRLSGVVVIKTGVRLVGKGVGNTVLKLNANANSAVVETLNFSTLVAGSTTGGPVDFAIISMTLDGNYGHQSGVPDGLDIYGSRFLVEDVTIQNVQGYGWRSKWAAGGTDMMEATIRRLKIDTCGRHGFWFNGPHDSYGEDIIILDAGLETEDGWYGFFFDTSGGGYGSGRWVNLHHYSRSGSNNNAAYALVVTTVGNEIIAGHFEGANRSILSTGDRCAFVGCEAYGVLTTNPMVTLRGSHVHARIHIEDTFAVGASCLQIGDSTSGLFNSHLDIIAITAATNAVVVTDDDGRNTGIIKTYSATNAYTGTFASNTRIDVQRPNNSFERYADVVGIGINSGIANPLHVVAVGASPIVAERYSNDISPAALILRKSRGTAGSSNVIVQSGDELARIAVRGADGSGFPDAAQISFHVDATPGSSDMPGRMGLWTTPDSASLPVERMRLDSKGNVAAAYSTATVSTAATDGLFYIPTSTSGSTTAPIGTPTSYTNMVPMIYNSALNRLYIFSGTWKSVALSS